MYCNSRILSVFFVQLSDASSVKPAPKILAYRQFYIFLVKNLV